MISQKCPKCLSSRVRRGYRPTPFWLKILFRYNLLCDNCNWEFRGFAVPGTVSAKPTKKPKKQTDKPPVHKTEAAEKSSDKPVDKSPDEPLTPETESENLQIESENLPEETTAPEQITESLPETAAEKVATYDNLPKKNVKRQKKKSAKKQKSGV